MRALLSNPAKEPRDNILVLVMWKLDQKLSPAGGISKREARVIARRDFRMTNGTDRRLRSPEKLWTMTTHTSVMIRIVGDVWILAYLLPVACGYLVAGNASSLMFLCRVQEL
jgi:hypothetical protein